MTVRVLPSDDPVASMNELASHPLDLENGPLLDLTVFERAGRAAGLLLRAHHLVSDAWSVELIFKDLSRAYAARRPARPRPPRSSTPATSPGSGPGSPPTRWNGTCDSGGLNCVTLPRRSTCRPTGNAPPSGSIGEA